MFKTNDVEIPALEAKRCKTSTNFKPLIGLSSSRPKG